MELIDVRLLAPLATLCGIIVTVSLWNLNKQRKAVSYKILECIDLMSVRGPARKRIELTFDGTQVEDAQLVSVMIVNSGHLPINLGDYQSPLTIVVNPGAEIVSADITETEPADLDERLSGSKEPKQFIDRVEKERVVLTPLVLNAEDAMVIQLLVRKLKGKVAVRGHLLGISKIREHVRAKLVQNALIYFGAFIMAVSIFCVEPPTVLLEYGFDNALPWTFLFFFGYVFLWAGLKQLKSANSR
jgi:hypothetical protein